MTAGPITVSLLDRANNRQGRSEPWTLQRTVQRAHRAEQHGYARFWVAEHHGVPGVAGAAPTVLMAAIASRTERIRVGSGGVMLPAHQPLVVAEQAATLAALFPGRVDLGLGRSLGFTPAVRTALRQDRADAERFEDDLVELLAHLGATAPITMRPQTGDHLPVFVLATGRGLEVAARLGLAVVVGGPVLERPEALDRYREQFRASSHLAHPYVIVSANVLVADRDDDGRDLLLPEAWAMAHARTRGEFPPLEPVAAFRRRDLTPRERSLVVDGVGAAVGGSPATVVEQLNELLSRTGADELLATGATYDIEAQDRSDELLAQVVQQLRRT